jgi:hypothetical protein
MKFISQLIMVLLLIAGTACSKEEGSKEEAKTQSETSVTKAVTEVINTEAISINNAQKALEDSKQVNQLIQDSAAQQRESIEKAQQ